MRRAVRLGEGLEPLLARPDRILLEVGPGQALSTLVRQHPAGSGRVVIAAMRDRREPVDDDRHLRSAVAKVWEAGGQVDWTGYWAGRKRRRVALPTYPFERQRCWIEPGQGTAFLGRAPEPRADSAY